jgi:hypothetical protein
MADTLQSVFLGAVGGAFSAVITYYATRAQSRLGLTTARDTELYASRLAKYKALWPMLEPLARYGRDPDLRAHPDQPIPKRDLQAMVEAIGELHASLADDLDTRRESMF